MYQTPRWIKKLEDVALSDKDISNMLNGNVNITLYPDLIHYRNLDELLGEHRACCLLFESKPQYGHWVAIFETAMPDGGRGIEFFNSYGDLLGGFPDDSLALIDPTWAKQSNQTHTYLSDLLINSPYKLTYNEYDFQKLPGPSPRKKGENHIRTCGRHCVVRLLMREYSLDEYKNWMEKMCDKYNLDPDGIVTLAT